MKLTNEDIKIIGSGIATITAYNIDIQIKYSATSRPSVSLIDLHYYGLTEDGQLISVGKMKNPMYFYKILSF